MTSVRELNTDDIEALQPRMKEFVEASAWPDRLYDQQAIAAFFDGAIKNNDILALTTERGGIAVFIVVPMFLNPRALVASELVFYGNGDALPLLSAVEVWAREKGAMLMHTDYHHTMKDASPLYERRGFAPFETVWAKVL